MLAAGGTSSSSTVPSAPSSCCCCQHTNINARTSLQMLYHTFLGGVVARGSSSPLSGWLPGGLGLPSRTSLPSLVGACQHTIETQRNKPCDNHTTVHTRCCCTLCGITKSRLAVDLYLCTNKSSTTSTHVATASHCIALLKSSYTHLPL